MKPKGVGFIELHVEKVILGFGAIVLMVVVGISFVMDPYAVSIDGRRVGPGEVGNAISRKVNTLKDKLANGDEISEIVIPLYSRNYKLRMSRKVALAGSLRHIGKNGLVDGVVTLPDEVIYYLPYPPMAKHFIAQAGYGVLADTVNPDYEDELIKLIGDRRPRDFRYVSVCGEYDLDEWIDRLEPPSDDSSLSQMPEIWWKSMLGVTAVYLQREELDAATDQWINRQIIAPIPSQEAYLPNLDREWGTIPANAVIAQIRTQQDVIARPPFIPLSSAIRWQGCNQVTLLNAEGQLQLQRLRERIDRLKERIERQEKLLENQKDDDRAESIQRRLDDLVQDLEEAVAERNTIYGIQVDSEPDQSEVSRSLAEKDNVAKPLLHQFQVWAHDLSVLPGKTYRYRVIVSILNPLFHRPRMESEQKQQNYHRLALGPDPEELRASPWSNPVTLDPEYYFFFTSTPQNPSIEVWRIYNGVWRSAPFSEQQGDPIGDEAIIFTPTGEELKIDMHVGAILIDVTTTPGLKGNVSRMYYLDLERNEIREQVMDPKHPVRIRLENEVAKLEAFAASE